MMSKTKSKKPSSAAPDLEKLGAFYLGKTYDLEQQAIRDEALLYDAKDLTTHGICVGMTGSGKTGLCLAMLEEAALDGIPTLAIDPKGDLGNLCLTFPGLSPSDFRPWIDESEAARNGQSADAYAGTVSKRWRKGLEEWNQDGERIQRFRDAADVSIYTPGSNAGIPITVLRSFDAPSPELMEDSDAMRERTKCAVSGLLVLLGIEADPIKSREHILLSTILDRAWRAGRNLNLPDIIREIQSPPVDRIGVFDLESFYPSKDRLELAMSLNNLLASPGFASWMEGEPLDIGRLLYTEDGRPRISILSIAHLSDAERMFFVTIVLNELLAWVRTQAGTSSLRAIFYMDEIFGYFPPTRNPPSKQPMLTLLKQARAYGVGMMLATQNPVDLDYKGLANTGTWFIGRMQTERDKLRVLDGLEGAAVAGGAMLDRGDMDRILSGLGSRVFLMHNVHEDAPIIFHTRWVLSFLRGPMTRTQIRELTSGTETAAPALATSEAPAKSQPVAQAAEPGAATERPEISTDVNQFFMPLSEAIGDGNRLLYRPSIYAAARVHYVRVSAKVDAWLSMAFLTPAPESSAAPDWDGSALFDKNAPALAQAPDPAGTFEEPSGSMTRVRNYAKWVKLLQSYIYQERRGTIFRCKELKQFSNLGESEGEFRGRLAHAAREKRDLELDKLRKKYGSKLATIEDRIRRAEQKIEKERSQLGQQKYQTAISLGATILGAFMGRKVGSYRNVSRATTTMRGAGRAMREKEDIARAEEDLDAQRTRLRELEDEFKQAIETMEAKFDAGVLDLEEIIVPPRKTDITIQPIGLCWTPWRITPDGIAEPLHR